MVNGQIMNIVWDNGCYTCTPSQCITDQNGNSNCIDTTCNNFANATTASGPCDPKVIRLPILDLI